MNNLSNRSIMCLHKMIREMYRKKIEMPRIIKCATHLLDIGVSCNSIPSAIIKDCISRQYNDGGFVGVADTIWSIAFLKHYGETETVNKALMWLKKQKNSNGYGRSSRDMTRIPVTGVAYYLLPELASREDINDLVELWLSEKNSLTYKAGFTLMALKKNSDKIKISDNIIQDTIEWLISQQDEDGGFAPWKGHPVGTNIYCTSIAALGLLSYFDRVDPKYVGNIYNYIINKQLKNGLWPYHEIEDGGAWGARTLFELERMHINVY